MALAKDPTDRRSARTRATLQNAHRALILKRGYEAVTIKDICAAADVGRTTFYAHYRSKDDLRRSALEHLRKELVERQRAALAQPAGSAGRSLGFSLALFAHARDHVDLYRALVGGRGGTIVLGSIRQMLCDLVRAELGATGQAADAAPRELAVQFVVGAAMAVMTWWLDGGAKLPPERVDAMFRRLATAALAPSPR